MFFLSPSPAGFGPARIAVLAAIGIAALPFPSAAIDQQSAPAQSRAANSARPVAPRFEVASIKLAPPFIPGQPRSGVPLGVRMDKARATFGGMSLAALISYAYGVKLAQVSGPDWLTTQRFDIAANLPEGGSTDRVPEMMQGLLVERFSLKLQRQTKEFPVYALVAAKSGFRLTPKPEDFDPKAHSDQLAIPILSVTLLLEQMVDRPVIDETGLQGQYLFPARAIQQALSAGAASARGGVTEASEPADAGIAALLLPVGMRLEKKRANLPVLVVESMRQTPTEN